MTTVRIAAAALAGALCLGPVAAQEKIIRGPNMPDPKTTIPEKVDPPLSDDTTGTVRGPTLSDQLQRSDGVIRPPPIPDRGMTIPAPPVGRTPVIPPPGSPGGTPGVDPK